MTCVGRDYAIYILHDQAEDARGGWTNDIEPITPLSSPVRDPCRPGRARASSRTLTRCRLVPTSRTPAPYLLPRRSRATQLSTYLSMDHSMARNRVRHCTTAVRARTYPHRQAQRHEPAQLPPVGLQCVELTLQGNPRERSTDILVLRVVVSTRSSPGCLSRPSICFRDCSLGLMGHWTKKE